MTHLHHATHHDALLRIPRHVAPQRAMYDGGSEGTRHHGKAAAHCAHSCAHLRSAQVRPQCGGNAPRSPVTQDAAVPGRSGSHIGPAEDTLGAKASASVTCKRSSEDTRILPETALDVDARSRGAMLCAHCVRLLAAPWQASAGRGLEMTATRTLCLGTSDANETHQQPSKKHAETKE